MKDPANRARAEAPGHSGSPGVEHSSAAEIASQQRDKPTAHFAGPPFASTYLTNRFVGIVARRGTFVNAFFEKKDATPAKNRTVKNIYIFEKIRCFFVS